MNLTLERIEELLQTRDDAVERALVAIWQRQTLDEQQSQETKHSNGIGFSGADARMGSYLAKWCLQGKHLSGRFLEKGRKIAFKYRKQLLEIALANAEANTKPISQQDKRS